jgi:hypothetical protein
MSLQSHDKVKGQQGLVLHDVAQILEERKKANTRAVSLIKDYFKCPDVTREEVLQMLSIIETNGHEIPIPDVNGQINRRLIGKVVSFLFKKKKI